MKDFNISFYPHFHGLLLSRAGLRKIYWNIDEFFKCENSLTGIQFGWELTKASQYHLQIF